LTVLACLWQCYRNGYESVCIRDERMCGLDCPKRKKDDECAGLSGLAHSNDSAKLGVQNKLSDHVTLGSICGHSTCTLTLQNIQTLDSFHENESFKTPSRTVQSCYLNPSQNFPTTLPFPSNKTPSSRNSFLFLSSLSPSLPFRPHDPINPPSPPPLAKTR
jgi:hypothetical protein